jgi:hypothetical protein
MEPDDTVIPVPVSAGEMEAMQANQPPGVPPDPVVRPLGAPGGYPPEVVTLPELFEYRGEMIDFQADASTTPAAFSPLCSFSGTLVMRGGGCKLAFGWYNAMASGGTPPADNEIYPLIPNDDPDVYGCGAFCPLAIDGDWTLKTFTAADISSDDRYDGGLIGFALIGDPATDCKQTHFSQQELNMTCTNCTPNAPWITSLTYQSTAVPDAFYLAFEDLPTTATSFEGPGPYFNDGDFNDFVFFITGLACEGGGEPCDTGLPGACGVGRTNCGTDGQPSQCQQVVQGTDEICDNVDNDCNELVDDGDLCDEGFVCDRGSCVAECNGGEFRCNGGLECEKGFCIDPLCVGVDCDAGEACRAGECIGACENVVCPLNQECQLGRCVDLCAAVTCDDGQVCERGVCISTCSCRPCGEGKACGDSGKCVDTGCEAVSCEPGFVCVAGTCTDACSGAACPGGAECSMGTCAEPTGATGSSGGSGGGSGGGITVGNGAATGSGASASGGTDGIPPGVEPVGKRTTAESGCACRFGGVERHGAGKALGLLLLGLLFGARRRRSVL